MPMQLVNLTPFAAERFCLTDPAGSETLVVVVKGTYVADPAGRLTIAPEQSPLVMADVYYGKPAETSVRYASDVSLVKPGTDVALLGHACAPPGGATEVDVTLKVDRLEKTVHVCGDRRWKESWTGASVTPPEPFEEMPLIYERAFGGADPTPESGPEFHPTNPVGTGFRAKRSRAVLDGATLPNLEDPASPIKRYDARPSTAGFGFVAPHWEPRKSFGGTYDAKWKRDRMPLLPADFSPRFYSAAAAGLAAESMLAGMETIEVTNAGHHGTWSCSLPGHGIEAVVDVPGSFEIIAMDLDTIVIEADEHRVLLTWRGSLNVHGRIYDVHWIKTQFARGSR